MFRLHCSVAILTANLLMHTCHHEGGRVSLDTAYAKTCTHQGRNPVCHGPPGCCPAAVALRPDTCKGTGCGYQLTCTGMLPQPVAPAVRPALRWEATAGKNSLAACACAPVIHMAPTTTPVLVLVPDTHLTPTQPLCFDTHDQCPNKHQARNLHMLPTRTTWDVLNTRTATQYIWYTQTSEANLPKCGCRAPQGANTGSMHTEHSTR